MHFSKCNYALRRVQPWTFSSATMDFFEWMVALESRHYRVLILHRRHTNPSHCSFHTKMHPRFSSPDHSRILHLELIIIFAEYLPLQTSKSPYIKSGKRPMKSGKRPYKIALTPLCFAETPYMFSGRVRFARRPPPRTENGLKRRETQAAANKRKSPFDPLSTG